MEAILSLLNEFNVKGTFFVVGSMARTGAATIRKIAQEGHEIASHSHIHQRLRRPLREHLAAELTQSKAELEAVCQKNIVGFRAPEFSVPPDEVDDFFEILSQAGYRYDSSIVPKVCPRYGVAGFGQGPRRVKTRGGAQVVEFPLSVLDYMGRSWMIAGGGYWRIMPRWLLGRAVKKVQAENRPLVTYLHNYEFERSSLHVPAAAGRSKRTRKWEWRSNLNRRSIPGKLRYLLTRFPFDSMGQLAQSIQDAPDCQETMA